MILNGLGFVSAPLYLFGQFFQGKAILSASDALREYKSQQGVERGFRFLKDLNINGVTATKVKKIATH